MSGPQFLFLYVALAVVVIAGLRLGLRFAGGEARLRITDLTSDPYRIACLRDGEREAIRVAIFNLVDRGLLVAAGETMKIGRADGAEMVRRSLDRAILSEAKGFVTAAQIVGSRRVAAEAARYHAEMANKGLLHRKGFVAAVVIAAGGLLGGVALARIISALSQGRHNVELLIALAFVACVALGKVATSAPHTRAGAEMLSQLERMTARLKVRSSRLKSGGETNEALLLAAVFGVAALPEAQFDFVRELFPRPRSSFSNTSDGSSCGSSCGSSGCGGGGGCGGCGGS